MDRIESLRRKGLRPRKKKVSRGSMKRHKRR